MAKADLYLSTGKKSGQISLPKEIFGVKVNKPLMAQAVRVYLSNQRRAGARAKNRGEVSGSRRKIWRQKGLGRARHGDRYAPIFVGGGKAHGPDGLQNYQLKLSKKMRRLALFSALTSKLKKGEIIFVKDLAKIEPKTKIMAGILEKLFQGAKWEGKKQKATLVLPSVRENLIRSGKNIKDLGLVQAKLLHPYQILNGGKIIILEESLKVMKETFLEKK